MLSVAITLLLSQMLPSMDLRNEYPWGQALEIYLRDHRVNPSEIFRYGDADVCSQSTNVNIRHHIFGHEATATLMFNQQVGLFAIYFSTTADENDIALLTSRYGKPIRFVDSDFYKQLAAVKNKNVNTKGAVLWRHTIEEYPFDFTYLPQFGFTIWNSQLTRRVIEYAQKCLAEDTP